jgi:arylsulfatase A-like enzyme
MTMRNVLSFLSLLGMCISIPVAMAGGEKPNILVIVSDDQGYVDVGFQGSKDVVTPNLDKLAASGVRCTSGYASHPFCSPTRAGLLTGRYQARFGHEFNPVYDPLDTNEGLPLSEKLLPQYLKEAGYTTGWIGKWHLGSSPSHTPWQRGFDQTYGFIGGGHRFTGWTPNQRQYTLPLTRNGQETQDVPAHLTLAFGDESAAFVRRNKEKPWMLYLAFNAPHTPHEPTAERESKFAHIVDPQRRRCLAQVSLLDDAVGKLLVALEESEQTQRTLVFFFGDNGGQNKLGADNGPLRDGKGSLYEGGVRVPYIVSWPGTLPSSTTFDHPVMSFDAFATALAAAGVSMPTNKTYDSVNLVPYLKGENKSSPHVSLHWRNSRFGTAIREGDWKLVVPLNKPAELYQVSNEIGEKTDLASEHPDVATRLTASIATWEKELAPPAFLGSSVKNEDWGPGGENQPAKATSPNK